MQKELKLSYISQKLWWKRSIKINSLEWRKIRKIVLEENNYQCYFCEVKSSKYMIVDHISGNATDNNLKNLRILCSMCDTIRHSGLAGIEKTLTVRISKLSQLEIVKKTREFFIKNKEIPTPEKIDSESIEVNGLPIDFATLEEEEIPEKLKLFKGFFTRNFFEKKITAKFLNYIFK